MATVFPLASRDVNCIRMVAFAPVERGGERRFWSVRCHLEATRFDGVNHLAKRHSFSRALKAQHGSVTDTQPGVLAFAIAFRHMQAVRTHIVFQRNSIGCCCMPPTEDTSQRRRGLVDIGLIIAVFGNFSTKCRNCSFVSPPVMVNTGHEAYLDDSRARSQASQAPHLYLNSSRGRWGVISSRLSNDLIFIENT